MEKNQMKNIVVLKNLPSNLVEEAILILKSKKNVRKIEYVEKKEINKKSEKDKTNYIIKEAESVLNNYINTIEKNEKKNEKVNLSKRYRVLKIYSICITMVFIFCRIGWFGK